MKKTIYKLLFFSIIFLLLSAPATVSGGPPAVNFTVLFKSERIPQDASAIIEKLGGKIVYSIPEIGVVQVQAPAGFAKAALGNELIQTATPSLVEKLPSINPGKTGISSINPEGAALYQMYQWDIKRVTGWGSSFSLGAGNHNVVVGIVDTGVDVNHPDLIANFLEGSKNFVPAGGFYGNDLTETGDGGDIRDRVGHGSHVAGSIAGKGLILGVAPEVGFRAYRVIGAAGEAYTAWITKAVVAAADDHSDIINMSLSGIFVRGRVYYTDPATGEKILLGDDSADYKAFMRAVDYADRKGSLVVAAAGNDALDAGKKKGIIDYLNSLYGSYGYIFTGTASVVPSSMPNVVTVSATGPDDNLALYSNSGNGFVDVAAPGGDVRIYLSTPEDQRTVENVFSKEFCLSSVPDFKILYNEDGTVITGYSYIGPGYGFNVGTSMAAPKASAVAALIVYKYGKMKPSQIKALLQKYAEDIGKPGNDQSFGHGLVNAYNALSETKKYNK
ncbi:MAG: S8 family serine peptidase [Desulfocucumaceae bacterium]